MTRKFLILISICFLCVNSMPILAFVPTKQSSEEDDFVQPFSFREEFDSSMEAISANKVEIPIYKKELTVSLK